MHPKICIIEIYIKMAPNAVKGRDHKNPTPRLDKEPKEITIENVLIDLPINSNEPHS